MRLAPDVDCTSSNEERRRGVRLLPMRPYKDRQWIQNPRIMPSIQDYGVLVRSLKSSDPSFRVLYLTNEWRHCGLQKLYGIRVRFEL